MKIGPKTLIVAIVALVFAVITVSVFYDMNDNSLDVRDREVRLIVTDSMDGEKMDYKVPTIQKNSLVVVRMISEDEKSELVQGDVIQFRYGNILNHHRVVENHVSDGYVITKGDNTTSTETVYYSAIRGEVLGADHMVGEVVFFMKTHVYVIVAFIAVLFIGSLLVDEIRRERGEFK